MTGSRIYYNSIDTIVCRFRFAALWVKNTVGKPRVSTMGISRVCCLNQYCTCLVSRKSVAKYV